MVGLKEDLKMKLTKATLEESRDILNLFFGDIKYSFKYSNFFILVTRDI